MGAVVRAGQSTAIRIIAAATPEIQASLRQGWRKRSISPITRERTAVK